MVGSPKEALLRDLVRLLVLLPSDLVRFRVLPVRDRVRFRVLPPMLLVRFRALLVLPSLVRKDLRLRALPLNVLTGLLLLVSLARRVLRLPLKVLVIDLILLLPLSVVRSALLDELASCSAYRDGPAIVSLRLGCVGMI